LFVYYNERALEGTVNEDAGAFHPRRHQDPGETGRLHGSEVAVYHQQVQQKPSAACYKQALSHQALTYHRIVSFQEMKMCLGEGYPFVFGFTVYESFRVRRGGEERQR